MTGTPAAIAITLSSMLVTGLLGLLLLYALRRRSIATVLTGDGAGAGGQPGRRGRRRDDARPATGP